MNRVLTAIQIRHARCVGHRKRAQKNCHKNLADLRTGKWVNIKTDLKYMRYENVDAIRLTKKTGEAAQSCQQ
jgi:hypothetical protein